MGNHELSPLMLYASHLYTRLHWLKNTLLAGLAPSCRKSGALLGLIRGKHLPRGSMLC